MDRLKHHIRLRISAPLELPAEVFRNPHTERGVNLGMDAVREVQVRILELEEGKERGGDGDGDPHDPPGQSGDGDLKNATPKL